MDDCHNDEASFMKDRYPCSTDGAFDRMLRLGQRQKCVPAIFIHAGAGFHSHQNEHVHLQACVAAAEMGMKFLKAGSTATEAIEASLRILEDKEITNAGYGSNLSIDGTVECDATIVDHLGRSGACGAVPNIRNPISLAKLVLDRSSKPLSLRRVPPNVLVGDGARNFAEEHGLATFSNDYLVSKNARDRFLRWQEDLRRADIKSKEAKVNVGSSPTNWGCVPCQYDTVTPEGKPKAIPRGYSAAVMAGTWNEGQPNTPYMGSPNPDSAHVSDNPLAVAASNYFRSVGSPAPTGGRSSARSSPSPLNPHTGMAGQTTGSSSPLGLLNLAKAGESNGQPSAKGTYPGLYPAHTSPDEKVPEPHVFPRDGPASPHPSDEAPSLLQSGLESIPTARENPRGLKRPLSSGETEHPSKRDIAHVDQNDQDLITDTIGAVAIDEKGQIAAGSSSGGIGMKHRGRLGPAALVGVGTAVIPCDEDDEDEVSVATVTSGTGEHMATTMASQRCAERIYHGTRRGRGGADVQEDDEDAIIESFIAQDFMNHPGVKNCHSAGAIGVMIVKKTRAGYYFYFAHNTDSFALASMGGLEKEPRCTMSRLPEGGKIAQGGRKIRLE